MTPRGGCVEPHARRPLHGNFLEGREADAAIGQSQGCCLVEIGVQSGEDARMTNVCRQRDENDVSEAALDWS